MSDAAASFSVTMEIWKESLGLKHQSQRLDSTPPGDEGDKYSDNCFVITYTPGTRCRMETMQDD
jgi:hypothetical protein